MIARFHYDDQSLLQLLSEKRGAEASEMLAHVETCETCLGKLDALSSGGLSWNEVNELMHQDEFSPIGEPLDTANVTATTSEMQTSGTSFLQPSNHPGSIGRFARYEIERTLGRGGMGIVMQALDTSLGRHCAVKVLAPELATSAAARKRFSREAKSAAAVVHPHVVPIQTVDEHDGLPYLVMPVVVGQSLQQRVETDGPLSVVQTIRIAAQVAEGLAAAHEQGLVHRDIKPANILLENGVERVQITDFGLARAVDDASMTRSGVIAGTPQYMSPEQAHGDSIDHRSDLFSLGSVIYFMLTGRSPFRAETTMGILNRISNDEPRSLPSINPEVPDWLENTAGKLLSKSPDDRYQTASEVATLLQEWHAHLQQPETVAGPSKPTLRVVGDVNRSLSATGRGSQIRGWLISLAMFGFFAIAGTLIVLENRKGTLRIESNSSAEIPIVIRQGDEVVDELTITQEGASTRLKSGRYVIEIDGDETAFKIQGSEVTLSQGNTWVAKITEEASDLRPSTPISEFHGVEVQAGPDSGMIVLRGRKDDVARVRDAMATIRNTNKIDRTNKDSSASPLAPPDENTDSLGSSPKRTDLSRSMTDVPTFPEHWGGGPHGYRVEVDREIKLSGRASVSITRTSQSNNPRFGTIVQAISAKTFAGQRLRFSGFIKTLGADSAGLWVRIDSSERGTIGFDNMRSRRIEGTTDWHEYEVVLDVGEDAATITFGAILSGSGMIWIDDLRLDRISDKVNITAGPMRPTMRKIDNSSKLSETPQNLDFELDGTRHETTAIDRTSAPISSPKSTALHALADAADPDQFQYAFDCASEIVAAERNASAGWRDNNFLDTHARLILSERFLQSVEWPKEIRLKSPVDKASLRKSGYRLHVLPIDATRIEIRLSGDSATHDQRKLIVESIADAYRKRTAYVRTSSAQKAVQLLLQEQAETLKQRKTEEAEYRRLIHKSDDSDKEQANSLARLTRLNNLLTKQTQELFDYGVVGVSGSLRFSLERAKKPLAKSGDPPELPTTLSLPSRNRRPTDHSGGERQSGGGELQPGGGAPQVPRNLDDDNQPNLTEMPIDYVKGQRIFYKNHVAIQWGINQSRFAITPDVVHSVRENIKTWSNNQMSGTAASVTTDVDLASPIVAKIAEAVESVTGVQNTLIQHGDFDDIERPKHTTELPIEVTLLKSGKLLTRGQTHSLKRFTDWLDAINPQVHQIEVILSVDGETPMSLVKKTLTEVRKREGLHTLLFHVKRVNREPASAK